VRCECGALLRGKTISVVLKVEGERQMELRYRNCSKCWRKAVVGVKSEKRS
jgi:hypothetical protein